MNFKVAPNKNDSIIIIYALNGVALNKKKMMGNWKQFFFLFLITVSYLSLGISTSFSDPLYLNLTPAELEDLIDIAVMNAHDEGDMCILIKEIENRIGEPLFIKEEPGQQEPFESLSNGINWKAIALWAGASILAYLVIRYGPSLFDSFEIAHNFVPGLGNITQGALKEALRQKVLNHQDEIAEILSNYLLNL